MKHLILTFVLLSITLAPLSAKAQTTVLENFIAFTCTDSFDKAPLINEIKTRHDTLILNCLMSDVDFNSEFNLQTCNEKKIPYARRDITTGSGPTLSAINGRYLTASVHSGIHHSGIALAAKENPLVQIPFSLNEGTISAELPALQIEAAPLDLWLYAYVFEVEERLQSPMAVPEELPSATFVNLVKKLDKLGEWGGNPQSITIPLYDFKADGFALIAQEQWGGPIHAMGRIEPGLTSGTSRPQN